VAEIRRYAFIRHLRSEQSSHVLLSRGGDVVRSGRGLSFWFFPMSSSVAEVPLDDRDLDILFRGRSSDFQEITTQGVITWRVIDADRLAERLDFTVDLTGGSWTQQPLDQVGQLLTELAQQEAWAWVSSHTVAEVLRDGIGALRTELTRALREADELAAMGLEVVTVRIADVSPTSEVDKALSTPTREAIQQEADKARFERRAIAVERERAIAENELNNRIELAKREEELIQQQGANERRRVSEQAESKLVAARGAAEALTVSVSSEAEATKQRADADAEAQRLVGLAEAETERARMAIYQELSSEILMALAARELAANLPSIEHLNLSPDLVGPALTRLADGLGKR
jgi:regulator of protease activity HflC (stomatin/prohibitin superfamily)